MKKLPFSSKVRQTDWLRIANVSGDCVRSMAGAWTLAWTELLHGKRQQDGQPHSITCLQSGLSGTQRPLAYQAFYKTRDFFAIMIQMASLKPILHTGFIQSVSHKLLAKKPLLIAFFHR